MCQGCPADNCVTLTSVVGYEVENSQGVWLPELATPQRGKGTYYECLSCFDIKSIKAS